MNALKDNHNNRGGSGISLTDLFGEQMLSELNQSVADALNLASTIVDRYGTPLTERANHSRLCDIVRSTQEGLKNCQLSARILGERAHRKEAPHSSPCYSLGLADAAAPIVVGGHHLGTWLVGQASCGIVDEDRIREYAGIISADADEMLDAYRGMRLIPEEAFDRKLSFLSNISQLLSQQAYITMMLSGMVGEQRDPPQSISEYRGQLEDLLSEVGEQMSSLQHCSNTDPVTGCYSRAYLEKTLPSELARSRRYGHKLSVLMADIDYFKRINDRHEHQAGDSILADYVATIQSCIRTDIDWVARYGGEEFVIVLPETGFENAYRAAERIRQTVDARSYTLRDTDETYLVSLTSSFGIGTFDPGKDVEERAQDLLRQADHHLYQAKKGGRNVVYPVS